MRESWNWPAVEWHMEGNQIVVDRTTFDPLDTIDVVKIMWPAWMRDQERGRTDA